MNMKLLFMLNIVVQNLGQNEVELKNLVIYISNNVYVMPFLYVCRDCICVFYHNWYAIVETVTAIVFVYLFFFLNGFYMYDVHPPGHR